MVVADIPDSCTRFLYMSCTQGGVHCTLIFDVVTVKSGSVEAGGCSPLAVTRERRNTQLWGLFWKIKVYKNRYSVVKGYCRFEKLLRNRYFTRYRVHKLRCLLD